MQKLPTYDAYNHKYIDPNGSYEEYKIWRKSDGYKVWLRKQWRIQAGQSIRPSQRTSDRTSDRTRI